MKTLNEADGPVHIHDAATYRSGPFTLCERDNNVYLPAWTLSWSDKTPTCLQCVARASWAHR